MTESQTKDLAILVADKNIEYFFLGLLGRYQSLEIRTIQFDIFRHPNRDPGCYLDAPDFLKMLQNQYKYALVVFDYQGCGKEHELTSLEIENEINERLFRTGWNNHARAIVIDPELENWIWHRSTHIADLLNWENVDSLWTWLLRKGYINLGQQKPNLPKEALVACLMEKRIRRSSTLYQDFISRVSLRDCSDRSFTNLKMVLKEWFSSNPMNL
jgi:hypothetical protein